MARLTKDVRDYWISRISENIDNKISNLNLKCTEQKETMATERLVEFMSICGADKLMGRLEVMENEAKEVKTTLQNIVKSVQNSFPDESKRPDFHNYGSVKFSNFKQFFLECCKNKLETKWLCETDEGRQMQKLRDAKNDALDYIFSSDTDLELLSGLQAIVSPLGIVVAKTPSLPEAPGGVCK